MTNIDIVTLTGLTATDGSVISAGAIIKFETEFPLRYSGYVAKMWVFRNKAIYDAGYDGVLIHGIEQEFIEDLGAEFFDLTPTMLYTKVAEHVNNHFNATVCEVQITE